MESLLRGRTRYVTFAALVAVLATLALVEPWLFSPHVARRFGSFALVGFPLVTALVCWWCAAEMDSMQMRRQWLLLGLAAACFSAGQFIEEFSGTAAASGLTVAKALYIAAILTFGAGTWMALRSFVGFLDVRGPMRRSVVLAGVVTVVGSVALAMFVGRMEGTLADKVILVLYPVGLLWLMAVPALALALTVSQMGVGALARPWWAVFAGVLLLTAANMAYVVVDAMGIAINNGGLMEFGWWVGLCSIAVGAALQIDVQKPAPVASA